MILVHNYRHFPLSRFLLFFPLLSRDAKVCISLAEVHHHLVLIESYSFPKTAACDHPEISFLRVNGSSCQIFRYDQAHSIKYFIFSFKNLIYSFQLMNFYRESQLSKVFAGYCANL